MPVPRSCWLACADTNPADPAARRSYRSHPSRHLTWHEARWALSRPCGNGCWLRFGTPFEPFWGLTRLFAMSRGAEEELSRLRNPSLKSAVFGEAAVVAIIGLGLYQPKVIQRSHLTLIARAATGSRCRPGFSPRAATRSGNLKSHRASGKTAATIARRLCAGRSPNSVPSYRFIQARRRRAASRISANGPA